MRRIAVRDAYRASLATSLDGGKVNSRRRLFMTTSPRLHAPGCTTSRVGSTLEVASMDDGSVESAPVLNRLTFGAARSALPPPAPIKTPSSAEQSAGGPADERWSSDLNYP